MKRILLLCAISMLLFSSVTAAQELSNSTVGISINVPDNLDMVVNKTIYPENSPIHTRVLWLLIGANEKSSEALFLMSGDTPDIPIDYTINNYTNEEIISKIKLPTIESFDKIPGNIDYDRQIINGYPALVINIGGATIRGIPTSSIAFLIIKQGKITFVGYSIPSQYFHHFLPIVWQSINTLHIE